MEQYHLHEATRTIYRFFWDEFCSWYLEMVKLHPEKSKSTLLFVFESALRLLHPFAPFISEELWRVTGEQGPKRKGLLIAEIWPDYSGSPTDTVDVEIYQHWLDPA